MIIKYIIHVTLFIFIIDLLPSSAQEDKALEKKISVIQKELAKEESGSTSTTISKQDGTSISIWGLAIQIVFGLIFVLALAIIGIKLLKALQNNNRFFGSKKLGTGKSLFEVLETCYLGQNQKLIAIKFETKVYMLGATAQNINLIKEIDLPQMENSLAKDLNSNHKNFTQTMDQVLSRFKKPKKVSDFLEEA